VHPANMGQTEAGSPRDRILHAVLVYLLPPRAPQQWSVWQGSGNQGKTVVGAAFEWMGISHVLAAEPLAGVGECWKLVGGQTVGGELGTFHESRRICF